MGKPVKENLLDMMERLLEGKYNCNDFSYDFPIAMFGLEDEKWKEILDDMPEICASYEPFEEDDLEVVNDERLKDEVGKVYRILMKSV